MPNGNRYAAAMDPQGGAPPQGAPADMPPQGPPQDGQSPALAEALQILSGHQGSIGDLLKDPAMHEHLVAVFQAVKQDPRAIQALQQAGIGPEKLQQFEQMLQQSGQGGAAPEGTPARDDAGRPAPHWLAR